MTADVDNGTDVPSHRPSSDEVTVRGSHTYGQDIDQEKRFEEATIVGVDSMDEFPDGGWRAWMALFGAMCNTFSTFGFVNAWGVFQAYYEKNILQDTSPSNIAWIGSIQYSLIFLPGLVIGRLFDLGYVRVPFLAASVLLVVATFLVAECTEYWHFLLCQGFAIGLACGAIFGPTVAVVGHWFKRKRGVAMGFASAGAPIGGTVFPIVARSLIARIGFPWTMRIFGFILMLSLGVSNLTLKRRLPPSNVAGGLFNFRAFKSKPFTIYCLSAFFAFLGVYTVLTYIGVSAASHGISSDFSFYLVAIANASSVFGRCICGVISDRTGPMNVMIPLTTMTGILTFVWPMAHSEASLVVIAVLYGFTCGAYVALLPNPMIELGETGDVGRRIGMFTTIFAVGALVGPPISGAIYVATGGFEAVGYYAGTVVLVAVVLMCITRHLVLRSLCGKI